MRLVRLGLEDLEPMLEIEKACFPNPWTAEHFRGGLEGKRESGAFLGVRIEGRLAAYLGWLRILEEVHILNLAVEPASRRKGLGRLLLKAVLEEWKDGATGRVGIVPLMEGADPIVDPEDAALWFERGVRLVGLAWKATRYSAGTGAPGPLTALGRKLVPKLDAAGLVLDLSHAADEAAYEALDLFDGTVIASHSNPRVICESDRQIPDELIRRIGARRGVIGAVPFNKMLSAGWTTEGAPRVPLSRVADAIHHVTQITGTHTTAAVGSDLDGGFGAESAPKGLETIADLPRLADEMSARFTDEQILDVLGRNWIRLLERALPER